MHPVFETLLQRVERDPLPEGLVSSYWREYSPRAVIERAGDALRLEGVEFGAVYARNPVVRLLHWAERLSYRRVTSGLPHYPAAWRLTKALARDCGFALRFDVWKCAVILSLLERHWQQIGRQPRTCAIIGDGYGFLGALIRRAVPDLRLYHIDLPTTLVFQARMHLRADPTVALAAGAEDAARVALLAPDEVESVPEPIDCAINIASMQEMNAAAIQTYFTFLRRRSGEASHFYCANRVRKALPGGEVSVFHAYPWRDDDRIYIDAPCPYYTHFLSPNTRPLGPRVLGVRVPFVNAFDGVHWHRLVRLAPEPR